MKSCPICQKESVSQIDVSVKDLFVCSECHSTFVPHSQMLTINRKITATSRKLWSEVLQASSDITPKAPLCLLHNQPLQETKIQDYGHSCLQGECCDLLHLKPSELLPIFSLNEGQDISFSSSYKSKKKKNLLGFVGRLFVKKEEDPFADLEELQFERKIKPLL